jgi:uncharacterized membrane protein
MDLNNYIKPELLAGIPILIIIGKILKETIPNKTRFIPLILGIFGMIFGVAYTIIFSIETEISHAVLTGIMQGILIAGAAVYGHQLIKQIKPTNKED